MRPTFSIIAFTVLSGAGYGLLFLTGLGLLFGWSLAPREVFPIDDFRFDRAPLPAEMLDPRLAFGLFLATGVLLATAGLLASVAHLGQPLRAWRAFSQWRSSWLSREGVLAVLTYVPVVALAWLVFGRDPGVVDGPLLRGVGLLLALCSAATVYCTAHIYSSLKPVRAWHDRHVLPGYFLLGLYSGALWLVALGLLRIPQMLGDAAQWVWLANAMLIGPACAWLKRSYWSGLDAQAQLPTAGVATGLDRFGTTRSFEQPHTEENYLTHEMGFVLARKHARKLRAIAFWLILLAPPMMLPLAWLLGAVAPWLVLVAGMTGIFVERWLFFAEARHAVMAYYAR